MAADLTAGDIDDNLNWAPYLLYRSRAEAQDPTLPAHLLADRITVLVSDANGAPIPHALVTVSAGMRSLQLTAGADGVLRIFPTVDGFGDGPLTLEGIGGKTLVVDSGQLPSSRTVRLVSDATARPTTQLDVLVILDTTGSMGDEIAYLTREAGDIAIAIQGQNPGVSVRFGLEVYRDRDDAYVVKQYGFTPNAKTFSAWVAQQSADGGGDIPEAMDQAVAQAQDAGWRPDAAKIAFLVADAPPHPADAAAFLASIEQLRLEGVRVHGVAASGVDDSAEALMREAAVLTQGRYAFLSDDSGIGDGHALPKVPCYIVTELKNLLVRIAASEIAGHRVEPLPDQVIRMDGHYREGICYTIDPSQVQPVVPVPTDLPVPPPTSTVESPPKPPVVPVTSPVPVPAVPVDTSAPTPSAPASTPTTGPAPASPTASPPTSGPASPNPTPSGSPSTPTASPDPSTPPHGDPGPTSPPPATTLPTLPVPTVPPMTMTVAPTVPAPLTLRMAEPSGGGGGGGAGGGVGSDDLTYIAAGEKNTLDATSGVVFAGEAKPMDKDSDGTVDGIARYHDTSVDSYRLAFDAPVASAAPGAGDAALPNALGTDSASAEALARDPWLGTLADPSHPDSVQTLSDPPAPVSPLLPLALIGAAVAVAGFLLRRLGAKP